jgi:hypothetical protein
MSLGERLREYALAMAQRPKELTPFKRVEKSNAFRDDVARPKMEMPDRSYLSEGRVYDDLPI